MDQKLKTLDREIEPEYVGAHSALTDKQCQNWQDAEPESDRFVPTKCGQEATHTVVMADGGGLHEIAMCDECGEPGDPPRREREWSHELRDG